MNLNKHTNATTLLEKYFDIAFAAPDGVKKLRELILSLAMQGKLVPQDPNDQPASELLKEIEAEKNRLVKEKKLKIGQLTNDTKSINQNIEIPSAWIWVKGVDLFFITKLAGFEYTEYINLLDDGEVPVIRAQNVKPFRLDIDNLKYIDLKTSMLLERCALTKKVLLVTFIGAGIGDVAIFDFKERWHLAPNVAKMEPFIGCENKINLKYIACFLNSPLGRREIFKHLKSTAQPSISMGTIRDIDYPLPPLAEQRRIVAKIDELMARCDELEKLRGDRDRKQIAVHNSTLNRLLIAKEQSEFNTAWQFITQHFSELYSVKENVTELRKAILQLAVMGKLVPQDPNDQPASELLNEIEVEKKRLVKEGKIKKPKSLPVIEDKEIPFGLPNTWEWVRLGEITSKITDGDHKTPPRISEGYRLLSAKNVRNGYLDFDNCDFISEANYLKSRERCCPEFNDLLIVSVGGTIGRTSLIPEDSFFALVRSVALIKPLLINSSYLKYSMDSSLLQDSIHTRKRGGAQPCLYLSEIEMFPFSLPPLAEQHRIVAKIDQLMALCDNLEKQIDNANSKQTNLLNAVMTKI